MTGLGHARSMRLPAYSGAGTPPICVFHNEESVRFSYKAPYAGATLAVYVEVENELGYDVHRDLHHRHRPVPGTCRP